MTAARGEDAARKEGPGGRATAARAVVLLSGGLDSATCLLIARGEGLDVVALSFDYGQRHAVEIDRARALAARYGAGAHHVVRIDFPGKGTSALTDVSIPVAPHGSATDAIPATYVPARNTLFLAHALAWAEVSGASDIFIGANAVDYSGYPDCRPEFIDAFERMANLGTKAGIEGRAVFRIRAPLIAMSKAQIVQKAGSLGLDFSMTSSCYEPGPSGEPCGVCDSCFLREKGFLEAGLSDPIRAKS